MRAAALQAPHWLVVIDKGSYETLTYFLNRTMAELWRRKHGGQLYERELEPPYWRAAKLRQTDRHQPHDGPVYGLNGVRVVGRARQSAL
jgi:hypothetical protein